MPRAPFVLAVLAAALAATQARPQTRRAAPPPPAADLPDPTKPHALGHFDNWVAATHYENGALVCYAFTRASASSPALPDRKPVVLTVAERPSGRDSVAIAAGFAYAKDAEVSVQVGALALSFYTDKTSAFAYDGRATVVAFRQADAALARSPGPRGVVVDTFSLDGFAAAYQAVLKACPAR